MREETTVRAVCVPDGISPRLEKSKMQSLCGHEMGQVYLMNVLIACERSGIVRDAFLAAGHFAVSCDLEPSVLPGPHLQCDVLKVLRQGWDLMIGHPPCRYLSYAANHVWNHPGRAMLREDAFLFFMELFSAPIPRICIENPLGIPCVRFRSPDQMYHPYYFGDPFVKRSFFWLKNLPLLDWCVQPTLFNSRCAVAKPKPVYIRKDGKPIYHTEAMKGSGDDRRFNRSRFFSGVSAAMAEQWGSL